MHLQATHNGFAPGRATLAGEEWAWSRKVNLKSRKDVGRRCVEKDSQTKPVKVIGSPLHFSEAASGPQSPSPLAGEHSKAILNELGYTDTQILQLLETRTVMQQYR